MALKKRRMSSFFFSIDDDILFSLNTFLFPAQRASSFFKDEDVGSLGARSKKMSRRHSGYSQPRGARRALRRSSGTEPNRSLARYFLRSQKHRRSRPFR